MRKKCEKRCSHLDGNEMDTHVDQKWLRFQQPRLRSCTQTKLSNKPSSRQIRPFHEFPVRRWLVALLMRASFQRDRGTSVPIFWGLDSKATNLPPCSRRVPKSVLPIVPGSDALRFRGTKHASRLNAHELMESEELTDAVVFICSGLQIVIAL